MSNRYCLSAASCCLAAALVSPPASSAVVVRDDYEPASRVCQGASGAFAAMLRTRPLAVSNAGAATAFVTCAWDAHLGSQHFHVASITLINRGAAAATVNCTFVEGMAPASADYIDYVPRTALVEAGQALTWEFSLEDLYSWKAAFNHPSVSCALPPGVEIGELRALYDEEVGA